MSEAKVRGGIGLRDSSSFNQALVAKNGESYIFQTSGGQSYESQIFETLRFMDVGMGSKPSFFWRSTFIGKASDPKKVQVEDWEWVKYASV